ncbi:MAG: dethiobiotin synthase [Betaproteobacteria bacterium]|jgi:dethiobiotin synthetase|nr:MAG: dethiobiotin synthase [Betaproteobacteria bacterium]
MARGCFVTGTDTEIGKTLISTALLLACRRHELSAVGMKPVAAGAIEVNGQQTNEDVEALVSASSIAADGALVNPYLFSPPIAPHIAAEEANEQIDASRIADCYRQLSAMADIVVVEGVGGFRVPLSNGFDTADLATKLALPVVMVVGLRLGCINHALLTAEAIRARALTCIGWVANQIDPQMERLKQNIAALDSLLDMPRLGYVEYLDEPKPETVALRLRLPEELVA